jgi:hypothetical protein
MSKQKEKQDITKQLGPLKEVDIKVKLPEALIDYINEIEVEKYKNVKDLGQYCSEQVIMIMTTHLDNPEDTVVKNYTIPKCFQYYYDEIMEAYCGWDMTK